ncbi:alpha/beta hydrolase family protein [Amycolatopsis samaneae]|uniref:alpha/beta hydrolase family protein n=1 Tax=Amycolatopsis samaneae TaxID=664691 RepID=UPI0031E918CB
MLTVLAATVALAGVAAAPASAAPGTPELALTAPTGGHPVARTELHLTDQARADPWLPDRRRELMVSVWYPARRPSDRPAAYVTAQESELLTRQFDPGLPPDLVAGVRTHASADAPLWTPGHRLPLVLLSPGWSLPRASLSGLATDLASRGYLAVTVDHTYESTATEFPGGRITDCAACRVRDGIPPAGQDEFFARMTANRAADLSFVLDALPRSWWGGRWIDRHRIAAVGHSAGGSAVLGGLVTDRRIRAAVSMDGRLSPPIPSPLNRPVLLLGEQNSVPGGAIGWDPNWRELTGWKRWLTVTGMGHESFSDVALLSEQLGRVPQPLPSARATRIVRDYVAAFLDLHLRGEPQPLLNGPDEDYPEVRFHWPTR